MLGAILHKLPEGMATYALLGGKKSARNLVFAMGSAILIPIGMLVRIPIAIEQPVMAMMAGVILAAVATTMASKKAEGEAFGFISKVAPYLAGALIGGVSCLLA
jgi:hypothetical protein